MAELHVVSIPERPPAIDPGSVRLPPHLSVARTVVGVHRPEESAALGSVLCAGLRSLRLQESRVVDSWQFLLDVVILLGVGAFLGALFERVHQSAIIGYLLAGTLLGPNVLHLIQSGDEVLAVSELGVALLLFSIGLEFSWARLRGMGRLALGSGTIQVVVTTTLGASVGAFAGLGLAGSIAVGAICAMSSTACVLRVLTSQGEVESVHGDRALGILLVQDMAVVPLVLLVSVLSNGSSTQEIVWGVLRTAGVGAGLVAALYVIFHHIVPRLLAAGPMGSNRELPLLVAIVSGLGSAVVAHAAGVSPALGAFATQVRADVSSLKTLLLTLFFAAIGMLTDPGWIAANALLVGSVVVAVVVGKATIVWAALRLLGARGQTALAAGICLGQLGEFSFVLAEIARGQLLDEKTFMLVVSTTVITMALAPYLVNKAPLLAARFAGKDSSARRDVGGTPEVAGAVIVIGYGPAGRAAAERIAELGGRVVVVDQNPKATREARSLGFSAVTGDAHYAEVLDHAGIRGASCVVVTVPGAAAAIRLVDDVRLSAPGAQILVRARFHRSLAELRGAGAHVVVDEEHEVGRQIAKAYEDMARTSTQDDLSPPK
ncbi:MAG TPA: sodium:proton exchanger [Gemmatimonadetes bacterium]|nr:sodium:proton exchanger [Gemmatimonadota bacterium]